MQSMFLGMKAFRMALLASTFGVAMSTAPAAGQLAPAASTAGAQSDGDGSAAEQAPSDAQPGEDIVVVARGQGTRDARVNNLQTVDAIGPRDIDSMPSQNLSDVLKRLPGVQVTYDNGEAQQPNIRGVSFIQTTVDGRETVTAGARALQIGDVPGDIVTSVEVYKTPSANLIEGGIGGLIAVKTKMPLDYREPSATGQLSLSMDGKRGRPVPQGSIAVGASWDTGIGRIGASLGVAHTSVLLRSDFFISNYNHGAGVFDLNKNGQLGDTGDYGVYPSFGLGIEINARHSRDSVIGNLQWAPSDDLTLTGSFFRARYLDQSQQYSFSMSPGATNTPANASAFTLVPNSPIRVPIVQSGTFANVPVNAQSLYVRPYRSVWQQSLAAEWKRDRWTIGVQGDFTQSRNNNDILIFAAQATAPNATYTGATWPDRGTIGVSGLEITNPASFTRLNYTEILPRARSVGSSQRIDVEFRPEGFLTAIQVGYRRTDRRSTFNQAFASNPVSGTLASIPGLATESPDGGFVLADPNLFIDKLAFRTRVGLPGQLPAFSPRSFFQLRERTDAGYVRALYAFDLSGVAVDGDVGLRGVRNVNVGNSFAITDSGNTPNRSRGTATDWLPSATVRAKLTDTLTARFSAAKTVARPDFTQLSPGLTLNADLTGSGGNPNLKSFYATGFDVGLDWLYAPSGYVTVAVFRKTLKGLVQPNAQNEVINGQTYRISRPINGTSDSSFKGVEINVNKKFVELPGVLSGLGVDANYTYLSSQLTNAAGVRTQIPGLAKHTLNSSAYYDRGPLLIRLGYTITSDFVNNPDTGSAATELGGQEIFGRQDVMDATLQYKINDHFRLSANLMNALAPKVGYYYGYKETPNNSYQTYRRYQVGLKFDF